MLLQGLTTIWKVIIEPCLTTQSAVSMSAVSMSAVSMSAAITDKQLTEILGVE